MECRVEDWGIGVRYDNGTRTESTTAISSVCPRHQALTIVDETHAKITITVILPPPKVFTIRNSRSQQTTYSMTHIGQVVQRASLFSYHQRLAYPAWPVGLEDIEDMLFAHVL